MDDSVERVLEELLVIRSQSGDERALRKLISIWHQRFLKHACYLTRNTEAARDVTQDAWLEIIRTLSRLNEPAAFRGWAFRIVSNKAVDWIRRRQKQRSLLEQLESPEPAWDSTTPNESIDGSMRRTVRHAIRRLPLESQHLLSMKYVDAMSIREIGVALGIPPGTVKSRLHKIRHQLKELLKGETDEQT